MQVEYSKLKEYYKCSLDEQYQRIFLKVCKNISKDKKHDIAFDESFIPLIKDLVDKDMWFYDVKRDRITANSESVRQAGKRLLKELNKYK